MEPSRSPLGAVFLLLIACAPSPGAPRQEPARPEAPVPAESARAAAASPWFSGIITSQILVSNPKGADFQVDSEQQFYVSGSNLLSRELSPDGALVHEVTYDPERNVLYRLAPEFEIIEPRAEHVEFSFTGQMQNLLDYTCHELERRGTDETSRVWVAPGVRVDPQAFHKLEYRGFVKQLEFTGGALELDAEVERDGYALRVKAVRVERLELDATTWKLEEARALAQRAP